MIGPHLLVNEKLKGDIKSELKKVKTRLPALYGARFEEGKAPTWNAHLNQPYNELQVGFSLAWSV